MYTSSVVSSVTHLFPLCLIRLPAAVECPLEPLQEIDNGHPLVFPGDSEGRLGYGISVTFECNEGYRLVQETTRTCQLNATWDGVQPHCESELKNYMTLYNYISF